MYSTNLREGRYYSGKEKKTHLLPISSLCLIYSADALNSSFFTNTTITVSHACNYHHETSILTILQMVKTRDSLALGHNESAVEVGSHLSFLNSFLRQ